MYKEIQKFTKINQLLSVKRDYNIINYRNNNFTNPNKKKPAFSNNEKKVKIKKFSESQKKLHNVLNAHIMLNNQILVQLININLIILI